MKRTLLMTTMSLALMTVAGMASAQRWTDTANGKGSLKMDRDNRTVNKVFYDFDKSKRGNIRIDTDRGPINLRPDRMDISGDRATLHFDNDQYRGDGRAEFRNGRMIRISLNLRGSNGPLNFDFDCDDRQDNWNGREGWQGTVGNNRPGWNNQEDNRDWDNDRNDRFGSGWNNWGNNTWDRNGNALTNWSGTREGRGPLRWEGHGSTNITRARVAAQRDGDTRITLSGNKTGVFVGRSQRRGDIVYVELSSAFGQRIQYGTAKIYLSRRFGEFFKVTVDGRDRTGRRFEGTFDDWN